MPTMLEKIMATARAPMLTVASWHSAVQTTFSPQIHHMGDLRKLSQCIAVKMKIFERER